MRDARLNFNQHVEHVSATASIVRTSLALMMPNFGGPKQTRRIFLSSVVTSVLTYVLAEKRRTIYYRRYQQLSLEKLELEERQNSIDRWQQLWDVAVKGRWMHRLIPNIKVWLSRKHGKANHYTTQMLSRHGCLRAYLHRFKHDSSAYLKD
ncbi:uncharacterized protein LOC113367242 [Ctenocephalides felis]|uniref:uncharacterized protein LOC113367242 n=1 Tax=Ctenocephalides felis TaxID=7515 RepID=UPI000E6E2B57|nr:uncharacterized protein LOC113367242 [Ctenocephalides felis]